MRDCADVVGHGPVGRNLECLFYVGQRLSVRRQDVGQVQLTPRGRGKGRGQVDEVVILVRVFERD